MPPAPEVGLVTWANHSASTLGFQEIYKPKLPPPLLSCQGIASGARPISLIAKEVQSFLPPLQLPEFLTKVTS